jgi:glycosyltransferase involved in cell wall biosynthesis
MKRGNNLLYERIGQREDGRMEKTSNSNISIIIPTLNEEENIGEVIQGLKQMDYNNILVIDARSTDKTAKIAKGLGAQVLLQNGIGKGDALRQAFNHDSIKSDVIVIMDADGSMSPEEIPSLIKALDSGADCVKGSRFLSNAYSKDMNLMRRIGNLLLIFVVNFLHDTNYSDLCYGFGAFRKSAIEKLYPYLKSKNFDIEAEVFIKAKKLGLIVKEVPSIEYPRKTGRSNLNAFRDGFFILKTIIQESFI